MGLSSGARVPEVGLTADATPETPGTSAGISQPSGVFRRQVIVDQAASEWPLAYGLQPLAPSAWETVQGRQETLMGPGRCG